jgi:hypothetical protein
MKNWGHRPGCWNFDDEKLVALGMKWPIEGRVHMVPAWSPDLHQVIEHAHGNTCRKFHEWLDDHHEEDPRSSVYKYVPVIEQCFSDGNPQTSILNNVKRLHEEVYDQVLEAEGDYIPMKFR